MAITRAQLLKELLPGLNELFGLEYDKYTQEQFPDYIVEVDFNEQKDSGVVVLKHQDV